MITTSTTVAQVINHPLNIPSFWLTFLVGTGIPFAVDLVTKRFTASWIKSVVLTVLSGLAGWLTSLNATGGSFDLRSAFTGTVISFVTAATSHQTLWQHVGLTGNDGLIQQLLPIGVGTTTSDAKHASTAVITTPPADEAAGA